MGWFTSKKRGHVVRDEKGTMIAKMTATMVESTLNEFGDEFKLNQNRNRYVYTGEGFSVGSSDFMKTFFWHGYTIDCASVDM